MLRLLLTVAVLATGVSSAAGCARARAQTVPDGPPLAVPTPPARVILPPEEPVIAALPPVETPPIVPSAPQRPPAARPAPPSATPAATTSAPPAPPPVVEPPRPSPPSAADIASERRIRQILGRATRDIGRITPGRLSAAGRAQYEQSRSLSEQAELAIADRNWVFAETLADKAATLAAELVGR